MNRGGEAVETAIKTGGRGGYLVKKVPRPKAEIIVCENNFHGRTTTIVGMSSEPQYKDDFGPYDGGFRMIPYGDVQALEKAITHHTVAFLVEPIQGEAVSLVPPDGFLWDSIDACRRHKALLAA